MRGGRHSLLNTVPDAPAIRLLLLRTCPGTVTDLLAWSVSAFFGACAVSSGCGRPILPDRISRAASCAVSVRFSVRVPSLPRWWMRRNETSHRRSGCRSPPDLSRDRPTRTPLLRFRSLQRSLACAALSGVPSSGRSRFGVRSLRDGGDRRFAHVALRVALAVFRLTRARSTTIVTSRAPAAGHASRPSSRDVPLPTCRPTAWPDARWRPAAFVGFVPSQCCSCPRVQRCLHRLQPTCRFVNVRLDDVCVEGSPSFERRTHLDGDGRSWDVHRGSWESETPAPFTERSSPVSRAIRALATTVYREAETALGFASSRNSDADLRVTGGLDPACGTISLGKPLPVPIRSWIFRRRTRDEGQSSCHDISARAESFSVLWG